MSLEQAQSLVGGVFDQMKSTVKPRPLATLEERRASLVTTVTQVSTDQQTLTVRYDIIKTSLTGIFVLFLSV